MDTRRDFIKKAMMLSGAASVQSLLHESIARAAAISPALGSTFADAEHVVILMQENRSFDHCFGTMKGVRGFNDPRFIKLPDGNPVWLQTNAAGETHVPFHFDIRNTKITWMGCTPHSRSSQVDAFNDGRYDRWLDVKKVGRKDAQHMPMTLGYYTRADVPFNYALADAFTVCDQNFCSAMTSTWPNRLYLWSGTIREKHDDASKAYVRNEIPYGEARWTTFPEVLEKNHVSWKVYQNEITSVGGFSGDERLWLSNFGCNPLEYLAQYNVRFSKRHVENLQKLAGELPAEIAQLQAAVNAPLPPPGETQAAVKARATAQKRQEKARKDLAKKQEVLKKTKAELEKWTQENFERLSPEARNLFEKAFVTNEGDSHFRTLETTSYEVGAAKREMAVPKGDILHQFRQDVDNDRLPAVSWLVGPANFSDHPDRPWYGSWYVSEVFDILTRRPEVWRKTIFIMTYDENDGYFDHVPPFIPPDPAKPTSGKCSPGIDTAAEFIRLENERAQGVSEKEARGGPIGLGFRVPMIVASPWTRGGRVCSQIFDHTSVFRFIQQWHQKKTGRQLAEDTISSWRKTISGDLTSAFRPYDPQDDAKLQALEKNAFMRGIHDAQFQPVPSNFHPLTADEIAAIAKNPTTAPQLPKQEPGVKPSCALPYELHADCGLSADGKNVVLTLEASKDRFGERAAGAPFSAYLLHQPADTNGHHRSYAVSPGDKLRDSWSLDTLDDGRYHLRLHGPNGFFHESKGGKNAPRLSVRCSSERVAERGERSAERMLVTVENHDQRAFEVSFQDRAYGAETVRRKVEAGGVLKLTWDQSKSFGWYDFTLRVDGDEHFERHYAGRIETGHDSFSDPFMGRVAV